MADFALMNSALQTALKKIGTTNGHAAPESQDPLDGVLHSYYVAKIGEKFFKDAAERTKGAMLKALEPPAKQVVDNIIASTKKNKAGESAVVAGGQHYVLDFTTRKGAARLDVTALKVALQVKHGLPAAVVDKLIEDASNESEPTNIFSVKPVRD